MTPKRVFVPVFPGTNCDRETKHWLNHNLEVEVVSDFKNPGFTANSFDVAVVPGGFTYGDYLRAGALAAESKALDLIRTARDQKKPVLGICNGFQILCESRILPGALTHNDCHHHLHGPTALEINSAALSQFPEAFSTWIPPLGANKLHAFFDTTKIPISCGMGKFILPKIMRPEGEHCDRWSSEFSTLCASSGFLPLLHYKDNEPGSTQSIAGIVSRDGRIAGMMPHPERASDPLLGEDAGLLFLLGIARSQNISIRKGSPLHHFAMEHTGEVI